MDPADFAKLTQGQTPQAPAPQEAAPVAPDVAANSLAQHLLGSIQAGAEPAPQPSSVLDGAVASMGAAGVSNTDDPNAQPMSKQDAQTGPQAMELGAGAGMLKSVFETKDFLFGDTPKEQQSPFRQKVEQVGEDATQGPDKASRILGGFSEGIGQFTTAMLGLGKLGEAAKLIGWVGKAAEGISASKALTVGAETGKAALAGAIAFDPHAERLSNWVQGTGLANPVNDFLQSKPGDSAAEGRMKNAMESIGMDTALIGAFSIAGGIYRAMSHGDTKAAAELADSFGPMQQKHVEEANASTPEFAGYQEVPPPEAPQPGGAGTGDASTPTTPDAGNVPAPVSPDQGGPTGTGEAGPSSAANDNPSVSTGDQPAAVPEAPGEPPLTSKVINTEGQDVSGKFPAGNDNTPSLQPKVRPQVKFNDEDTIAIFNKAKEDQAAIEKAGGRFEAAAQGYKFSPRENAIPYHKFNSDADLDDFVARGTEAVQEQMDKLKGGDVLHDEDVNASVAGYAKLAGVDPAAVLGQLQSLGAGMRKAAALLEVGYTFGMKAFQDAYALNARMELGDWSEFGSKEAMGQEVMKRMSVAGSLISAAQSIKANSGRTLRRMRGDIGWVDMSAFKDADMDTLSQLLSASKGNPNSFKQLANPSFWSKASDWITALRINSLVSGPLTQFYNVVTTGYMVGARPMQRIIGATLQGDLRAIDANVRQYVYMGSALTDGWRTAVKAFTDDGIRAGFKAAGETSVGRAAQSFVRNDSKINPHSTETFGADPKRQVPGQGAIGAGMFRPMNGLGDLFHNIFSVAGVGLGIPTRALGATDELFKQIVYRSKVMANAHSEAMQMVAKKGMTGPEADAYVKNYMQTRQANAFDPQGRGTDADALREAQTATFQQDLLPGTLGKGISTLAQNHPAIKWVLPFIKTPTNVIRESWKMTPLLNMAQGEYRDMLMGRMGAEAQSQALGQFAMGTAFMGAAAWLSSTGRITGGGPSDYKVKQQLMATGWKPYSFVWMGADGKPQYIPYNRLDPVATPFGMIADIQDAIHNTQWDGQAPLSSDIETALGAMRVALSKQFTSKSYLLGLSQTLDSIMNADDDHKYLAAAGGIAQSLVPYSALTRQTNDDVYMRDARSITDKMMQVIPGQSANLPAQYDWLGRPVLARPGLWTEGSAQAVDAETVRLGTETGQTLGKPLPTQNGIDLRTINMADGRNAYTVYQQLTAQPHGRGLTLEQKVARAIDRASYKKAPDGDVSTKYTKLWRLSRIVSKNRADALKVLKRDPNVRKAFMTPEQQVRDHYRNLRADAQQPQTTGLAKVGQAYGVQTGQ